MITIKVTSKTGLGNLARYIIRACFSQERMVYVLAKKQLSPYHEALKDLNDVSRLVAQLNISFLFQVKKIK